MRNLLVIIALLIITGCATPSEIHRTFNNGMLTSEIVKYENSTFHSVRVYGIDIGFDVDIKIPRLRAGCIKYESARIRYGQRFSSSFTFEDVSLIKGSGSGSQAFVIENDNQGLRQ